jgi:hypothetical protein
VVGGREGLEARELGHHEVDLHGAAAAAVALDRRDDAGGPGGAPDEVEHQRARVHAGGHHGRAQPLPAGERDAVHPPALDVDARDLGVGAHDRPRRPRRGGQRLGDRAHPAHHLPPGAGDAVDLADRVVQQVVRGARRAGAGPHADDAGRGQRALQRVGLEEVVEQVGDRGGHHAVGVGEVGAAQAERARGERQRAGGIAGRRDHGEQRPHDARHALEQRLVLRVGVGVAARDRGQLRPRALRLAVAQRNRLPVGRDRRPARVAHADAVAVAGELEVGDDAGVQQADHVGAARHAVARPQLLGDAGAAEDVAALEHAHAPAREGEVRGGGQPVVSAADDDGVEVGDAGAHASPSASRTWSANHATAASRADSGPHS